jgi:hypothetical protein
MRAKCIRVHAHSGAPKDPELTLNKYYSVLSTDVKVMGQPDPWVSVIGDLDTEIERPSVMFHIFKEDVISRRENNETENN